MNERECRCTHPYDGTHNKVGRWHQEHEKDKTHAAMSWLLCTMVEGRRFYEEACEQSFFRAHDGSDAVGVPFGSRRLVRPVTVCYRVCLLYFLSLNIHVEKEMTHVAGSSPSCHCCSVPLPMFSCGKSSCEIATCLLCGSGSVALPLFCLLEQISTVDVHASLTDAT